MKLIFMGTGAAEGIPRIMCRCSHCQKARKVAIQIERGMLSGRDARLKRRILRKRSSVLIKSEDLTLILDTPPETHRFLSDYAINHISAIFLSHKHFDHIWGFRELELWDKPLSVYGGPEVIPLVKGFVGIKRNDEREPFRFQKLYSRQRIDLGRIKVIPFRVEHKTPTFGFLFEENGKKLIHLGDSSAQLSTWHIEQLRMADIVVFHTPTFEKHKDHISVKEVIELVNRYNLKKVILSHISHKNFPHDKLIKKLETYPIKIAYDGMRVGI